MSPSARYQEAKRQYDAIATLAAGGDKSAIASLPGTANTFLEQSRAMFASSSAYVRDFQMVQTFIGQLTEQYGTQLSVEEKMLAELQAQNAKLERQIALLQGTKDQQAVQSIIDNMNKYSGNGAAVAMYASMLRQLGFSWGRDANANGPYYATPGSNQMDPNSPYYVKPGPALDSSDVVEAIEALTERVGQLFGEQTQVLRLSADAGAER